MHTKMEEAIASYMVEKWNKIEIYIKKKKTIISRRKLSICQPLFL